MIVLIKVVMKAFGHFLDLYFISVTFNVMF